MATTITAGNATNGLKITPDNTGILELKTGTGAGTTALTLNASQNATVAGALTVGSTLQVAGVTTNMYPIVSGTTITLTNQTAPDFTGIPSWAKRITVMFNGVGVSSSGNLLVQLGDSGGYETTGYASSMTYIVNATAATSNTSTGFLAGNGGASFYRYSGALTLTTLGSNVWVGACNFNDNASTRTFFGSGSKTLSDTLTSLRLFVDGSQQFNAGTVNIMWE